MDDGRIWEFETGLWTGDEGRYRQSIDPACLMVVPADPFILTSDAAIETVSAAPRWTNVELSERAVTRPVEGLIVVAYRAEARRDGSAPYVAHCTSTYRRLGHEAWTVVQHQQTPPLIVPSGSGA